MYIANFICPPQEDVVIVSLLGKFTVKGYTFYILGWYISQYSIKLYCTIVIDFHYFVNLKIWLS